MYRLYGWKLSGSLAIEAALREAGAEFEMVPVDRQAEAHKSEDFMRLNPRCQVPVLTLPDGTSMSEGAAILLHIADAFPEARLAPVPGSSARAQHDRWLLFMAVNVYEGELRKLNPGRYTDDPSSSDAVRSAAFAYVDRHYRLIDGAIVGPYFFGDVLTMLDIYIWMLAQWMDAEWLASECAQVRTLARRVAVRPQIAPVHAFHFG